MVKFLDVNKQIIDAIFLLDGSEDEIREGLNDILEEKGKKVKKKTSDKKKKDIPDEPKRVIRKRLFKKNQ